MSTKNPVVITIERTINAPIERVWSCFNEPEHITQWNHASPDWHSPRSVNDLRAGGRFSHRMEAKDGSFGFDFSGTYDQVEPLKYIKYHLDDDRKVEVWFTQASEGVHVKEDFEAENENEMNMQRMGWQAILDNFGEYCERV